MNKTLIKHHEAIAARQRMELIMMFTAITAIVSIWIGFALTSAILGA